LGSFPNQLDTLIKKVSGAVGGVFAPWQIKRVAKVETEASLIKAEAEIEITDLHLRAMHRFVEEEAKRQENLVLSNSITYCKCILWIFFKLVMCSTAYRTKTSKIAKCK